ncbi:hypothetical protein T484DRAFT_1961636, partial [Baffinella frigidus]
MEGGGETGEGAQQDAVPVHEEHGAVESEGRVPDGAQTSSEQENDPEYSGASGKDLWDRVREYLKAGRLVAPENADEFFQRRERRKAMVAWFSAVDGVFEQKRLVDLTAIAQNYTVANNTPDAVSNMRAKQALYNSFAPPKPTSFESSIIDWLSSTMHRVPAFVNRMVTGCIKFETLQETKLKNAHVVRSEAVHARTKKMFPGPWMRHTFQVYSSGDVVVRIDNAVVFYSPTKNLRVVLNDPNEPLKLVLVPKQRLKRGVEIKCDTLALKHRWIDALVLSV